MDTRFLSTLIGVIQHGSFAGAARVQGLTAAAVAQRVRALEAEIGTNLVTRSGHAVVPTAAGRAILPRAQRILHETTQLAGDIAPDGLGGSLRLGAISTSLADHVPAIVERFAVRAPNAELIIVPGSSLQLYEAVRKDEIDIAFIVKPPFALPKALSLTHIADQPLVLAVNASLASQNLQLLLQTEPLLIYDRSSWGGRIAWDALIQMEPAPRIRCELDAPETIATLVANGLGIAILPRWQGLSNVPGVRLIPLGSGERQIVAISSASPKLPALNALCLP